MIVPLPHVDREIVRRGGFLEYVDMAWEHVCPEPIVWSWHMEEMCKELEQVARDRHNEVSTHLAVCVPPASSKSLIISVLWQTWVWTWWPESKWITCTYEKELATDLSRMSRDLVQTQWYQARWPLKLTKDADSHWINEHGGWRRAVGTGGAITGKHAHFHVGDDLIKEQDSRLGSPGQIARVMAQANSFWFTTMGTRKVAKAIARVLIGQRLHEDDPPGVAIRDHGYRSMIFPARFEPDRADERDHRKEPGELLCEERCDEQGWRDLEATLGPRAARAQLQQDPPSIGGKIIKSEYLSHRYIELPADIRRVIDHHQPVQGVLFRFFWDMNFKGKEGHSRVVGQLWSKYDGRAWLIDAIAEHTGFLGALRMMRDFNSTYPFVQDHRLEDAANAPAVQEVLEHEIPGVNLEPVGGGNLARVQASEGKWAAGNIMLPHDASFMGGADGFVAEHLVYDGMKTRPDDHVAAASLATVNLFPATTTQTWAEKLRKARDLAANGAA